MIGIAERERERKRKETEQRRTKNGYWMHVYKWNGGKTRARTRLLSIRVDARGSYYAAFGVLIVLYLFEKQKSLVRSE